MNYKDKLIALRAVMKAQDVAAFLVPRTDEYQNEFVAPYAERLAWLTGFTGSAGMVVVLADKAAVFTDGRYTIQIRQEVDGDLYEMHDSASLKPEEWLKSFVSKDDIVAYNPMLYTPKQIAGFAEALKASGAVLQAAAVNMLDEIWADQPEPPRAPVEIFPDKLAGQGAVEKRAAVAAAMKEKGAGHFILSAGDSIAWLLNIRGGDVECSPLALSYAVIDAGGQVDWFIESEKVNEAVRAHLGPDIRIVAPEEIDTYFSDLVEAADAPVGMDFSSAPVGFKLLLEQAGARVLDMKDPCVDKRAIKNAAEQAAIRAVHVQDGVAIVKFWHWLEGQIEADAALSEMDVVDRLEAFRREHPAYRGPSFHTIAGFGANGAIVHYRPKPEKHGPVNVPGFLLLDSGGQYMDGDALAGTTDITRTIALGDVSEEAQRAYTLVLKGHIAVAQARFDGKATGKDIDALARAALQEAGLDYAHGTGHGVGCYLCVHEEAATLSSKGTKVPQPGMLLSNEPGYYKEGEFGIRTENLVLVQAEGGENVFETVTLVPIDMAPLVPEMLTAAERGWLNEYHARVYEALAPHLDEDVQAFLERKTAAV